MFLSEVVQPTRSDLGAIIGYRAAVEQMVWNVALTARELPVSIGTFTVLVVVVGGLMVPMSLMCFCMAVFPLRVAVHTVCSTIVRLKCVGVSNCSLLLYGCLVCYDCSREM